MDEFRIETERLILRDWREDDWPRFWELTNTPAVMRWLGGVADEATKSAAQSRLENYNREHGHTFWALQRKGNGGPCAGELIGFCGLKRCNQTGGPIGAMEIGWRLREEVWGYGYAREAASESLNLAFDRFNTDDVVALTVERNAASWGLMRRLCMERRPDLDFDSDDFDADSGRIIVYAITREQWREANSP